MSVAKYINRLKNAGAAAPLKLVDDALDYGSRPINNIVHHGGKFIGKSLVKKTDKSLWNGYTGYKESGFAKVAAVGATALWGVNSVKYNTETMSKVGNTEYANEAPNTTYDGVSSTRSAAPTLGASGSMVFGMHNGRKG